MMRAGWTAVEVRASHSELTRGVSLPVQDCDILYERKSDPIK